MKNRRSRILAMMLSFVMLTGEALPVFAEGEVSADEVVIEEAAEEDEVEEAEGAAEEAEEAEEAVEETPAAEEEVVEEVVETVTEEAAEEAVTEDVAEEEVQGEAPEACSLWADSAMVSAEEEAVTAPADDIEPVGATNVSMPHMTTGSRKTYIIKAGTIVIDDITYELNANVSFAGSISYRGRKIKPIEDLGMTASCTGINNLIKRLSPSANPSTILKWKATAKKNRYVTDPAYFNVKVSVDSKAAKAAGISGKNLKKLKKAVSALNKVSKKKESRISFSITPLNLTSMWNGNSSNYCVDGVIMRDRWSGKFISFKSLYARLDPTQPTTFDADHAGRWSKISKKDCTLKKQPGTVTVNGRKCYRYEVTPTGRNFTGSVFYINIPVSRW